jgi:glycosyltransferase involved in cell wall biosynthesis
LTDPNPTVTLATSPKSLTSVFGAMRQADAAHNRPEISVIAPAFNEGQGAPDLVREIAHVMQGRAFEIIFIEDCSRDDTRARLLSLKAEVPQFRLLSHRVNSGQSRAIRSGVEAARAPIIATLDGDGQNDPADIPALIRQLTRPDAPEGLAMVQGRRLKRQDTLGKRVASKLANWVRKAMLKDAAEDSGCGIKAYYREAYLRLPYFDHMHRYMPALMTAEGFGVEFMGVNHRARQFGASNYTNWGRLKVAWEDMRGVMWLAKRRRNPGGVDEL